MKLIRSIYIILISILYFTLFSLDVSASKLFPGIESKITIDSSEQKIIKMQKALKDFGLYKGKIDGKYESVKESLLAYQKKTGLIKAHTDYGAGYFGVKTLTALKEDYSKKFEEVTKKHLQMDKPKNGVKYFYVTAYYSPLPGQKRYTTGTYRGDIILNGGGKVTASGKGVFTGLLAAPRNYKFGTKIELEGLGIGSVEDRGGAIVNAGERGHEYDRIDVWMGYGDEGLARALKWGKRKIKGKIVYLDSKTTMEFDTAVVSKYLKLKVDAEKPKKENVEQLQKLFTEIKLYTGSIDGNFSNIKDELIKYQVKNNIIKAYDDPHAGYFGDKTIAALREDYGGGIFKLRSEELDEDLSDEIKNKLDKVKIKVNLLISSKYGKNTQKSKKYKTKLRVLLNKELLKTKNKIKKQRLNYLKSIL